MHLLCTWSKWWIAINQLTKHNHRILSLYLSPIYIYLRIYWRAFFTEFFHALYTIISDCDSPFRSLGHQPPLSVVRYERHVKTARIEPSQQGNSSITYTIHKQVYYLCMFPPSCWVAISCDSSRRRTTWANSVSPPFCWVAIEADAKCQITCANREVRTWHLAQIPGGLVSCVSA